MQEDPAYFLCSPCPTMHHPAPDTPITPAPLPRSWAEPKPSHGLAGGSGGRAAGGGILRPMTTATAGPRRGPASPLNRDDLARAEQTARRLTAEMARVVRTLPDHAQNASGMARHLGIVRTTCQRLVSALQEPEPTPETLVRLPGVQGLRQLLDAVRARGGDEAELAAAGAAVDRFEELLRDLGGSQSRLAERLEAAVLPAEEGRSLADEQAREALFQAAAQVTGRACETIVSLYAFMEAPREDDPDGPDVLHRAFANVMHRSVLTPGGMPMVFQSGNTLAREGEGLAMLDRTPARGSTPSALLDRFTTQPLPAIVTRGSGEAISQVVDPARADPDRPFDVAVASRGVSPVLRPETGRPSLDEIWSLANCPARRMVLDVWLHEAMERRYRPSLACRMWMPGLTTPGEDPWVSRLPHQPRLTLLGRGTDLVATEHYARQRELTEHLFERLGWDAGAFVGFRCEVRFPIWRSGYCMSFEHLDVQPRG